MENYIKRISDLEKELFRLKNKKAEFILRLNQLSIGDKIYLYGGFDEYYPQVVKKIDKENCEIHTFEKSINKIHILTSFHIKENGKFVNIY